MAKTRMYASLPPTGPRRTLGLLVDWLRDLYQNSLFIAIAKAAEEYDTNLLCMTGGILESPDAFWSQRNVLYEFVGPQNVDGLIITAGTMGNLIGPERLTQYLERYRPLPLISTAYRLPDYSSVIIDNEAGMRAVLEHVVAHHGRRRVAFIRGPEGNQEAERRFTVYRQVLDDYRIDFDAKLVFDGSFARDSGIEAAQRLLASGVAFDALAAANDLMALGAMETLRGSGIRIPEQTIVVGFDDIEDSRFAMPQLTTVRQPFRALGREAVRLALTQIDGLSKLETITLSPELVVRRSCGCALDCDEDEHGIVASVTPLAPRDDVRKRFVASFGVLSDEGISVDESSVLRLFDALLLELDAGVTGEFATQLVDLVRATRGKDVSPWYAVVRVMYRTISAWTSAEPERRARAQKIRRQVRTLIGDMAELTQGQERLRLGEISLALAETSKALTATFSLEALGEALCRLLPRLDIPGCMISLYEKRLDPRGSARVKVAFHQRRASFAAAVGRDFDTAQLAPTGVLFGSERCTFVVEPLFFGEQQFGFSLFGMGPNEGLVYEALRDQISGALKGGALVAQLVDEAQRRQIAEKEQAEKELKIAARIQTMILPKSPTVPTLELAAIMDPAVNVGGDYYDILPCSDGCWIGIGDVAGHGLGSGLIMLMMQSMVSALVHGQPNRRPSEVVAVLNSLIYENVRERLGQDEHVTFCLMRIRENGRVVFAGAHEDILVYRHRRERCDQVAMTGVWLGIMPIIADEITDATLELEDGDVLLLYTDGVTEARDVDGRYFGLERLQIELSKVHERSATAIRDHLLEVTRAWMSMQQDDITLLVARYRKPST